MTNFICIVTEKLLWGAVNKVLCIVVYFESTCCYNPLKAFV